jgi:hypothetical protein
MDFKNLINTITAAIDKFNSSVPATQRAMLREVLQLVKELETRGDRIKVTAENIRRLASINSKLQRVMLTDNYLSSVKEYLGAYSEVVRLQNEYFLSIEQKFKPPRLLNELRKQAIQAVTNQLTENGLNANVVDKVAEMIRKAVSAGGSYNSLSKQLTDFIVNNETGEGQLLRYTKQISTDALNQFSGQYTQLISSDLGFEWFRYSGSNIETTRPFCLACTERKFFHISELPKVLRGEFEEFKKYEGKINPKTKLPTGMIPGTDVSNFMTNRGGYNCGHQWRPVTETSVPQSIILRVKNSEEYKAWAKVNKAA